MKRKGKDNVVATQEKTQEKTPRQIYMETGVVPEGYVLDKRGRVRKIVTERKTPVRSEENAFIRTVISQLTFYGIPESDIKVARHPLTGVKAVYCHYAGQYFTIGSKEELGLAMRAILNS